MGKTTVTAIVNQKGGTAKTVTTENLGVGLAQEGRKVLLVDCDPQASLTISLGHPQPDDLNVTLTEMLTKTLKDESFEPTEGILHHAEGVDLMPANLLLSGMEASLVTIMSRESVLKDYLRNVKEGYDHVLLDCQPSLGMLTINALAAADNLIIPVQAQYLSAKGLEQLIGTVQKVRRNINPKLQFDGILLTMVDSRTNNARETSDLIRNTYGNRIRVFNTSIPHSVRAAEISAEGVSIYKHDPHGKVADAYRNLTKEVLQHEQQRRERHLETAR